ncbi:uncharacterized protein LOC101897394 [Musca domestica]|uniref:Uncharacterized protein LOC101897394 n=1 Tax=Musca domestica TaxID=7370 RepID=A0A1I8NDV4_MUSDO|nr:uncharacterized protein LOC101897394 [Musca domestica]
MSGANKVNTLVGATTRYIAGRNATQTSYWRTATGGSGRLVKYNKTCEFDRAQKMPSSLRNKQYCDQKFQWTKPEV